MNAGVTILRQFASETIRFRRPKPRACIAKRLTNVKKSSKLFFYYPWSWSKNALWAGHFSLFEGRPKEDNFDAFKHCLSVGNDLIEWLN
jgi:hypothetical protein